MIMECNADYGALMKNFIQILLRDDCVVDKNGSNVVHASSHVIVFLGGMITLLSTML